MSLPAFLGIVVALVVGCYLYEGLIFSRRDANEPPYIRPRAPLIGHLVAFLKKGTPYFGDVETKFPLFGIFTLPIFSFKLYVVADRQIFGAVQRNAKTVSFVPFSMKATRVLSSVGDEIVKSVDILSEDEKTRNFARQIHHVEQSTLSNGGSSLDRINLTTSQEKLRLIEEMALESSRAPVKVDLYEWILHVITLSASTGFYGPQNPYKDPQHEKDFWTFTHSIPLIMSGLAWLFAPKAHEARNRNRERYWAYFRAGGVETASDFIKERTRVHLENGAPPKDSAVMNTGFDTALISNYIGVAFWSVYYTLSHPGLLEAVREEAAKAVVKGDKDGEYTLDLSILRTSCPLLVSVVQETQRMKVVHANIREVIRDTNISAGGKDYMFKKGNYVQLHAPPVLRSKEIWGEDADTFEPRRFIRMRKDKDPAGGVVPPNQMPSMAFPVWGVAPHVCPARFYATSGVLVLVALVALRLDISPAGPGSAPGAWRELKDEFNYSSVTRPTEPVPVTVRPRGDGKGKWNVVVGEPNTRLQFSVA